MRKQQLDSDPDRLGIKRRKSHVLLVRCFMVAETRKDAVSSEDVKMAVNVLQSSIKSFNRDSF